MKVKSKSEGTQSCLTLSDPMDCSLPGSSIHGIFQARVLEWVAIAFSILTPGPPGKSHRVLLLNAPAVVLQIVSLNVKKKKKIFFPTQDQHREGNGTPLQYSCLENPMDGGAWWAAVHGVAKSRTRLSDFTLTFHFHALEKEMAAHSSVLAWRIPGTGEPGGLPSMGLHRVGYD